MNKHEFDKQFDHAFDSALKEGFESNTEVPDPAMSWQKVQKQIGKRKKRVRWMRRLQIISVAASCLLIGALFLSPQQITNAFQPMYQLIKGFQDDVITFTTRGDDAKKEDLGGAKTPPPPDHVDGNVQGEKNPRNDASEGTAGKVRPTERVSLKEAIEKANFHLFVPQEVPEGFELDDVELNYRYGLEKSSSVQLEYIHPDGRNFYIMQLEILPSSAMSSGVNRSAGTIKEVFIQGHEGYLVLYHNGRVKVEWVFDNVRIAMIGDLSEEEALLIANSME